ncbi:hypothetical protein [Actinocorallia sp. A-T 12471]|uniref:hypothetical protein n=1 Tax=Actinocorallia sp. A-T 12471 TaxID=3089813 RepID=UPI0029CD3E52|nr:hypothetical protein [Actinocorallia sp. A-T 12471]MDX6740466.1 hypothetical protein [Actinocorallia sp. A-T 12471]
MPDAQAARRPLAGDPGSRRAALEGLATLLRRRGFTVQTAHWHLTAVHTDGTPLEVWCHSRPEDSGRLWFTHPGGTPLAPADHPAQAATHLLTTLPNTNPTP